MSEQQNFTFIRTVIWLLGGSEPDPLWSITPIEGKKKQKLSTLKTSSAPLRKRERAIKRMSRVRFIPFTPFFILSYFLWPAVVFFVVPG